MVFTSWYKNLVSDKGYCFNTRVLLMPAFNVSLSPFYQTISLISSCKKIKNLTKLEKYMLICLF